MTDPAAKTSALSAEWDDMTEAEKRRLVQMLTDERDAALSGMQQSDRTVEFLEVALDAARTDYEARIAALEEALAKYEAMTRECGCTVDSDYPGGICPPCGHREHGRGGCRALVTPAARAALLATPPTAETRVDVTTPPTLYRAGGEDHGIDTGPDRNPADGRTEDQRDLLVREVHRWQRGEVVPSAGKPDAQDGRTRAASPATPPTAGEPEPDGADPDIQAWREWTMTYPKGDGMTLIRDAFAAGWNAAARLTTSSGPAKEPLVLTSEEAPETVEKE